MAKPWLSVTSSRISDSGVGRDGFDFADHAAKVERQLGVELARQLLHALVLGEAGHVQQAKSAIARGKQRAPQQRRADAVALPRLLDTQRRLGLAREVRAKRPQFGAGAHHAVDKAAVHDGVERSDRST